MIGQQRSPVDRTTVLALCHQANEVRQRNELDAALQMSEQALDQAKKLGDIELEGDCLVTLADIHHDRENYPQAEALYHQALGAFQRAGAERGQGEAQLGLGVVHLDRGNLEQAEQSLLSALELAQRVKDPSLEGAACVNLGLLYTDWGQLQEARTYHERAVRLFEAVGSDWGIATQYTNLALVYVRLGQIEEAVACHERALATDLELDNERGVATDYGNLGDIYYELGDLDRAAVYYQRSLEQAQRIAYRQQEGRAHNGLGLVAVSRDDPATARKHYAAALEAFQAIGFRQGEAGAHVDLGYTLALCGDVEAGLQHCQKGLEIYRALGHLEGQITGHLCLGYISLILRDDPQEAINHYADAREMAVRLEHPDLTWRVYVGLGSSYYRAGQLDEAQEAYHQVIEAVESIWVGLWQEESKLSFMGSKSGLYTASVMLSILRWSAGEDAALIEAFEYLERGKSRAFLDLLGQTPIAAPKDVDTSLLRREAELVEQLRVLTKGLATASGERRMTLLQRANKTYRALEALLNDVAQVTPEYVALRHGEPVTWEDLQACLQAM